MRASLVIAIGAATLYGCSDTSEPAPQPLERFEVVARPAATDTALARPVQGIVVVVRTETGQPSPGTIVQFQGLLNARSEYTMLVRPPESPGYSTFVAASADSKGQAIAQVQFGPIAGPGRVEVAVPEFGLADTLEFEITPAAAAQVRLLPRDTAIHPGAIARLQAYTFDQFGNRRSDPVSYELVSTPSGVATVASDGAVTATDTGLLKVIARLGSARDTAFLSVVPHGRFLANEDFSGALVVMDLDGTGRQVIRPAPQSGSLQAAWSPGREEIVVAPTPVPGRMEFVSLSGTVSEIIVPPTVGDPYGPSFSRTGQLVYFTGIEFPTAGLYRVPRDGGAVEQLASCICYHPSAAPDGRFVALQSVAQDGSGVVVKVFDTVTREFLGIEVHGRYPAWSPAGDRIAILESPGTRIILMNPNGSGQGFLTPPGRIYFDQQLSWSTDGTWILAREENGLDLIDVRTGLILPLPRTYPYYQPALEP